MLDYDETIIETLEMLEYKIVEDYLNGVLAIKNYKEDDLGYLCTYIYYPKNGIYSVRSFYVDKYKGHMYQIIFPKQIPDNFTKLTIMQNHVQIECFVKRHKRSDFIGGTSK
jgi:cytoplasmic iron level regulating protein YaaA (DUF328/UPF0246 family)